jgi:hypothetical protein
MKYRMSHTRRAWFCIRGIAASLVLLTFEAAFAPHSQTEDLVKPALETPYGETRVELLRALDAHAGKHLSEMAKVEICDIVAEVAVTHGVDPMLILSVMAVESEFYFGARSSVGALGFMQLRPNAAFESSSRIKLPMHQLGLFDWRTNIELGAAYLRFLRDRMGSWPMALAAYNWGPTRVVNAVREHHGLPKQMRAYEHRVSKAYHSLSVSAGKDQTSPLALLNVRSAI